MRKRTLGTLLGVSALSLGALGLAHRAKTDRPLRVAAPEPSASVDPVLVHALRTPSGAPASLSCERARRVVRQARSFLAAPAEPVDPKAFAEATVDWLDPDGLWSAAPDAPIAKLVSARSRELLHELEDPRSNASCEVADDLGAELGAWVDELRDRYEASAATAKKVPRERAYELAAEPIFEDGPVTRPARDLASDLGLRVGTLRATFGDVLGDAADAAIARALPHDEVVWSDVLLAAAVRAYVPQIDPHGGWAPFDEETSLYEVDLEASPPPRLWRRMSRTALGVRVDETESDAIGVGDVILGVDDVAMACLSVEQAEQLALIETDADGPASKTVLVLGPHDEAPRTLEILAPEAPRGAPREVATALPSLRVPYGGAGLGSALVVAIGDVPDDLGEELAATIAAARHDGPIAGLLLDLRGNGGGSTDGANGALGLFLGDAPLFPLKRRDGSVEVERAPAPAEADRFGGPVAVLVDGDTASAAEMITGALGAYHRGVVIGSRTYGKGCAQEYLDDDANAGVLRLTTLVYALPDGSPVQRVGITPELRIGASRTTEREANLLHSLAPWRGPDLREAPLSREVPWPGHGGAVGPCEDAAICRALRSVGALRSATARGR